MVSSLRVEARVGNDANERPILDLADNLAIFDTNHPISCAGVFYTISYHAGNQFPIRFVLVDDNLVVKWVSEEIIPDKIGRNTFTLDEPMFAGVDYTLGVYFSQTGTIPFDHVGADAFWTPRNSGVPPVDEELPLAEPTFEPRQYSWVTGILPDGPCSIADTTPPIVTVPADQTIEATGPSGALVSYPPATAEDDVNGTLTPACLPASGSLFPLDTTTVTCSATDAAGNAAPPTSFAVTVQDTTSPTASSDGISALSEGDSGSWTVTASCPSWRPLGDPGTVHGTQFRRRAGIFSGPLVFRRRMRSLTPVQPTWAAGGPHCRAPPAVLDSGGRCAVCLRGSPASSRRRGIFSPGPTWRLIALGTAKLDQTTFF